MALNESRDAGCVFQLHRSLVARHVACREATREELLLKHSAEMLVTIQLDEDSFLKAQMNRKIKDPGLL